MRNEDYTQVDPWNEYKRKYAKLHPDKQLKWRLNSAKKLLQEHGFSVIDPEQEQDGKSE